MEEKHDIGWYRRRNAYRDKQLRSIRSLAMELLQTSQQHPNSMPTKTVQQYLIEINNVILGSSHKNNRK